MADQAPARCPAWFAALGEEDQAECLRELGEAVTRRHPGPLEAALAEWKTTGEALSDPAAREVLTAAEFSEDEFTEVARPEAPGGHVQGHCPACGWESLTLAAGGCLTCGRLECPRPDAASVLLSDSETAHIVVLRETEFTVRHPLIERLDDALMSCDLHAEIAAGSGPPFAVGRYRVTGPAGARRWEGVPS